jgi:predicted ester cyclase
MYRFEDGKIAERWAIRDELGMLKQLGAFDADPG